MRSRKAIFHSAVWLALCVLGFATPASAVTPQVLSADFSALIDRAADRPEQFAVGIPNAVSSATAGEWTERGSMSTWEYAVRVPTAVSLSFHAPRISLPPSAVLTVSGERVTTRYRASDIYAGRLWSRPLVGDTLRLSLSVTTAERARLLLELDSVQAGYRGFGGVPDHPRYAMRKSATATTQSCVENFECHATAANRGPARAIVAILIGNEFQCTGTLLNNTRNDFTPYILTARHCQKGDLGGGDPSAAENVTVYWDAVTACGSTLGSIYDGSAMLQYGGATTVVEQQDAWLIKLNSPPVEDAYWAGWDATGGVFTGGYAIHHALGKNRQYVEWYGQALAQKISAAALKVSYDSDFWGLVNQIGSVGAGASGGALFDPDNRVVGNASLAALQNGSGSPGVCPLTPPSVPSASKVTAQYTSLSAVFGSTADKTGTGATLQSVLDPSHSGKLQLDGLASIPVTMTLDSAAPFIWQTPKITWDAPGAQSCIASGGIPGDGWAGSRATSGTFTLTGSTVTTVNYSISCTGPGLKGQANLPVSWIDDALWVTLGAPASATIGWPFYVYLDGNVLPCTLSGGTPGDNWSGTISGLGYMGITPTRTGNIDYVITCGAGTHIATAHATVRVDPMTVTLRSDAARVRAGSTITLTWDSGGLDTQCAGTNGSPTDGWSNQKGLASNGEAHITESAPGTYTYGIHCTMHAQSADAAVTVVFNDDPPMVTLTALSPTQAVYPQFVPTTITPDLQWSSNVSPCTLSKTGPLGTYPLPLDGQYPGGTATDAEYVASIYTYELQCGAQTASAAITWTTAQPAVTLFTESTAWVTNQPYQIRWNTNTLPCTQSGGAAGDGWAGQVQATDSGPVITESTPGTYTFTLSCGSGSSAGSAQLTVTVTAPGQVDPHPTPSVTLTADKSKQTVGGSIMLNWNSQNADTCTASGGANGDGWSGDLSLSGSMRITESSAGSITYGITCTGAPPAATAQTTVSFADAPSAGGKGGGGAMDVLTLWLLSVPVAATVLHRRDGRRGTAVRLPRR